MSQANVYEQYLLELINAQRAQVGAQPLAFDDSLNRAAEEHSRWMIATDTFSHSGAGGSSPGARMAAAGYTFSGAWAWGENIAWMSTRAPAGLGDEVEQLHAQLMNSSGHRANLLNDSYREVGLGFEVGQYAAYEGAFVTENFARTASNAFLTGVVFSDVDGDQRYDIHEGLGRLSVIARHDASGALAATQTGLAGGYDLELAPGSYTVTFSGGGFAPTSRPVVISDRNVKLDLMNPNAGAGTPVQPPPINTINGSGRPETLTGTAGADLIRGFGGSDRLFGGAGNDAIDGGSGNDRLAGQAGSDTLAGGSGRDVFVFDAAFAGAIDRLTDFSPVDDTIWLDDAVFKALPPGALGAEALHTGSAAHDASDRIIYDARSGALLYDADGSGGSSARQFAQLPAGLTLSSADFYVV